MLFPATSAFVTRRQAPDFFLYPSSIYTLIFTRINMGYCMSEKDIRIVPNDLEIYFKGFEVAFKRRNIDDAILYLNNMKKEIDYSIESLEPARKETK